MYIYKVNDDLVIKGFKGWSNQKRIIKVDETSLV